MEYAIDSEVARDFLMWVKDTDIPDETFFTTLNYNPQLGVPGSYTGWLFNRFSTTKSTLIDLILVLHQSVCRIHD